MWSEAEAKVKITQISNPEATVEERAQEKILPEEVSELTGIQVDRFGS